MLQVFDFFVFTYQLKSQLVKNKLLKVLDSENNLNLNMP